MNYIDEEEFEEQNIKPKIGRKLAREELFKIVFESEILNQNLNEVFSNYLNKENNLKKKLEIDFIQQYINGISENIELIKNKISSNMENWELQRIGLVERSLLIIATYEILKEDLAAEIIVNEAVELAKEYGDVKAYEFINGVLAKIIKNNRK